MPPYAVRSFRGDLRPPALPWRGHLAVPEADECPGGAALQLAADSTHHRATEGHKSARAGGRIALDMVLCVVSVVLPMMHTQSQASASFRNERNAPSSTPANSLAAQALEEELCRSAALGPCPKHRQANLVGRRNDGTASGVSLGHWWLSVMGTRVPCRRRQNMLPPLSCSAHSEYGCIEPCSHLMAVENVRPWWLAEAPPSTCQRAALVGRRRVGHEGQNWAPMRVLHTC